MITLHMVYLLAGVFFAAIALINAGDRGAAKRWGNALFWGLVATSFILGSHLGDFGNGLLVIALALIGGLGFLGPGAPRTTDTATRKSAADRRGDLLFLPALVIPAVALTGGIALKDAALLGEPLFQRGQATLISLAIGAVVATLLALALFRPPAHAPFTEGRRLMDTVGWAALLPQLLASLGAVFAAGGVGEAIGQIAGGVIPEGSRIAAVVAYCGGMAVFTVLMGNAFAAFPVMTAAIGLPIIVGRLGGDPAIMGAIGMLSGFCGTLMTPMAANFNVVPAALLQLADRDAVIKAQIPTALPLLAVNMALMYFLVFRF
jgi:uncharacterized membrane protein